jgi:hypothetical protein
MVQIVTEGCDSFEADPVTQLPCALPRPRTRVRDLNLPVLSGSNHIAHRRLTESMDERCHRTHIFCDCEDRSSDHLATIGRLASTRQLNDDGVNTLRERFRQFKPDPDGRRDPEA